MCGRYIEQSDLIDNYHEYLRDFLAARKAAQLGTSRFNIAPTQRSFIRTWQDDATKIRSASWGLLPVWAKDKKFAYKTINARSETAHEKPSFRSAFKKRRCLVLATGYYEWKKLPGGKKQTYYIHLPDNRPFFFRGLWETWNGPKDQPLDTPLTTFTILTTESFGEIQPIHDRMPCLTDIDADDLPLWLDAEFQDTSHLNQLLANSTSEELTATAVGSYVNNVRNQGPDCIAPLSA